MNITLHSPLDRYLILPISSHSNAYRKLQDSGCRFLGSAKIRKFGSINDAANVYPQHPRPGLLRNPAILQHPRFLNVRRKK